MAATIDTCGKSGPRKVATYNPASVRSNLESSTPEMALAPERENSLDDGFDTQTSGVE
jgi:hypothetical protein